MAFKRKNNAFMNRFPISNPRTVLQYIMRTDRISIGRVYTKPDAVHFRIY